MNKITAFNLRAYCLIIDQEKILLSNELIKGRQVIKFPGGGVEFGEGLIAALKREAVEEMKVSIEKIQHFYTTDFFQQSEFKLNDQLISIYFTAQIAKNQSIAYLNEKPKINQPSFFWKELASLNEELFHFPIDKHVCSLLKKNQ